MNKTNNNIKHNSKRRIHSIDITRGLIVILSVLMFSIPSGIFQFDGHADWYGLTLLDFILPCFITIFGTSMAIAYHKGVKWRRFFNRTIKLILFGLIFNMIVAWSIDLSSLRFTGVLQMFAVLGVGTVIITKFVKHPIKLAVIGISILCIHGFGLLYVGSSCEGGLPQPDCNPSGIIDPIIFGENHIYVQGERGYDPEGVLSIFAALGNVLLGFVAGRFLILRKGTGAVKQLILYSILLIVLAFIFSSIIPFGKRLWTPSFGLLTAGVTSLLLAIFHLLFDEKSTSASSRIDPFRQAIQGFMVAFGRNSFLIYFGKYILNALLVHITIQTAEGNFSINQLIIKGTESVSSYPALIYTIIISGFWTIVTLILHKYKWYLKV